MSVDTNKTAGPAAGATIKRDVGPALKIDTSQNKYLQGALSTIQNSAIPKPKDPGIAKDSRMTGNSYSVPKKTKGTNNFLGSLGQGISSETAQGVYSGISIATDIGNQFIDRDFTKNPTGFNSQQAIGDALLKSGNPYAMVAGAAYKALSGIAEATGGNINTITKDQANEVGLSKSERFFNNVLGVIPGMG